jgi:hypothetical protein
MAAVSRPGPFGIRVPVSTALARSSAAIVALASLGEVLAVAASEAFATSSAAVRVVCAGAMLVLAAIGVVGGAIVAVVGPFAVPRAAVVVYAAAGIAAAVPLGLDLAAARLLPPAALLVVALALAYHLLAAPDRSTDASAGIGGVGG